MEAPITTNVARRIIVEELERFGLKKPPRAKELCNFFVQIERVEGTTTWEYRPDFEKQIDQAIKELSSGEVTV